MPRHDLLHRRREVRIRRQQDLADPDLSGDQVRVLEPSRRAPWRHRDLVERRHFGHVQQEREHGGVAEGGAVRQGQGGLLGVGDVR